MPKLSPSLHLYASLSILFVTGSGALPDETRVVANFALHEGRFLIDEPIAVTLTVRNTSPQAIMVRFVEPTLNPFPRHIPIDGNITLKDKKLLSGSGYMHFRWDAINVPPNGIHTVVFWLGEYYAVQGTGRLSCSCRCPLKIAPVPASLRERLSETTENTISEEALLSTGEQTVWQTTEVIGEIQLEIIGYDPGRSKNKLLEIYDKVITAQEISEKWDWARGIVSALPHPIARDLLRNVLTSAQDSNALLFTPVARSLVNSIGEDGVNVIASIALDVKRDVELRERAVEFLKFPRGETARNALLSLLDDTDSRVRWQAYKSLKEWVHDGDAPRDVLLKILQDGDPWVREQLQTDIKFTERDVEQLKILIQKFPPNSPEARIHAGFVEKMSRILFSESEKRKLSGTSTETALDTNDRKTAFDKRVPDDKTAFGGNVQHIEPTEIEPWWFSWLLPLVAICTFGLGWYLYARSCLKQLRVLSVVVFILTVTAYVVARLANKPVPRVATPVQNTPDTTKASPSRVQSAPRNFNQPAVASGACHPVEQAPAASATIPSPLSYILDTSSNTTQRMRAVDGLSRQQSPEVTASLTQLLQSRDENEALRNNVANKLRECGDPSLVSDLTTMLWDEKETPKWRNYCVQHLYQCFEDKPDPAILATLFKAAECNEKMVRICAVWSLALVATPNDKSKAPDEATVGKIRAIALAALREKDAHFLITEAGVQSCARLVLTEALPEIRALAASDQTKPEHLRIVSVAALGDLKDTESIPLLEKLSKEATGQLQSAAKLAIKRIIEAEKADTKSATPVEPDHRF